LTRLKKNLGRSFATIKKYGYACGHEDDGVWCQRLKNVKGVERLEGVAFIPGYVEIVGCVNLKECSMCAENPYHSCGPNDCKESELRKKKPKRMSLFLTVTTDVM